MKLTPRSLQSCMIHVPRNLLIGFTMHCETKCPELKNNQSKHLLGFFVVVFAIVVFLISVCSSLLLFSLLNNCYNWDKNLLANFSYSFFKSCRKLKSLLNLLFLLYLVLTSIHFCKQFSLTLFSLKLQKEIATNYVYQNTHNAIFYFICFINNLLYTSQVYL